MPENRNSRIADAEYVADVEFRLCEAYGDARFDLIRRYGDGFTVVSAADK
jgi:hypothetical protein